MIYDLCKNGQVVRSASTQVNQEFEPRIISDKPEFHPVTEYLNEKLTIKSGQVTQSYVIKKYSLEETKLRAIEAVKESHAEALDLVTGSASTQEKDTWAAKARQAEHVRAGDLENAGMITKEAEILGITPEEVADSVLVKAVAYSDFVGFGGGLKKATINQIKAATTNIAIKEILINARETMQAFVSGGN